MTAGRTQRFADDVDRLVRGAAPSGDPADDEYRALLRTADRLARDLCPLRRARPGFQAALETRLVAQLPEVPSPWWRRLLLPGPLPRLVALPRAAALVLVLATALAGTGVAAGALVRVHPPERLAAGGADSAPVVAPLLPPPGALAFRAADPARAAETGRPIAYLPEPPPGVDETTEVGWVPASDWADRDAVALAVRSGVRYRGGGHTVLVVLDEPSPALAQRRDLVLGDRAVRLADGREAWTSTRPNWPVPNVVALVVDRYVVLVASDLAPATVERLASQVVLAPDAGAAEEGVAPPGGSPAPLPRRAAAGPADLAVSGGVTRVDGDGIRVRVHYRFQLGNRGGAAAERVRATLQLPATLAAHVVDAPAGASFDSVGPGALAGFGGDVALDAAGLGTPAVRAALAEGLRIRLTWTEGGQERGRTLVVR